MVSDKYYPSLSAYLPVEKIPDWLSFIVKFLDYILVKRYVSSTDSSSGQTDLTMSLLAFDRLSYDLPGIDCTLTLNPTTGQEHAVSEFDITIQYVDRVSALLKGMNLSSFSYSAEAFFVKIQEALGMPVETLIRQIRDYATPDMTLAYIVNKVNSHYELSDPIIFDEKGDIDEDIQSILSLFRANSQLSSKMW